MTWQYDKRREKLYFVRGTDVHELDLETGAFRELFRQAHSNIGNLLLKDGKLLFTVHAGSLADPAPPDNQLVALDPETGAFTRYGMEPGIHTYKLDARGIIMAKPQKTRDYGTEYDYFLLEMETLEASGQ